MATVPAQHPFILPHIFPHEIVVLILEEYLRTNRVISTFPVRARGYWSFTNELSIFEKTDLYDVALGAFLRANTIDTRFNLPNLLDSFLEEHPQHYANVRRLRWGSNDIFRINHLEIRAQPWGRLVTDCANLTHITIHMEFEALTPEKEALIQRPGYIFFDLVYSEFFQAFVAHKKVRYLNIVCGDEDFCSRPWTMDYQQQSIKLFSKLGAFISYLRRRYLSAHGRSLEIDLTLGSSEAE